MTTTDEGYNFDYTGEIQEFTAPKTGIYSLETWGSQGGNASDGTNSARGGYGAYAYGEVLLTQGDKLYINVGGQNGYGGGGLLIKAIEDISKNYNDFTKLAQAQGYSLVPLESNFGSDKLLLLTSQGTPYSSSVLSYSGGEYMLNVNGDEFLFYIPLSRRFRITHFSCDIKMPSSSNRYYIATCCLIDSDLVASGQSTTGALMQRGFEKTGGSYYADCTSISDDNWHTLSFDCNQIIDYIRLDVCINTGYFKNIKLTVQELP